MDGKFQIKLQIVGRYYPLVIERKDEERYRRAARLINEKVAQYKQKYKDKDIQDFLAMTSLQFVLKELDLNEKLENQPMLSVLRNLTDELEDLVQKE